MNIKKHALTSVLLFLHVTILYAQDKKEIIAQRIQEAPKIDGILDDAVWKNIPASGNFSMWQPGNEGIIPENLLHKQIFLISR